MEKFIYVRGEDARDRLLSLGYALLKSDKKNQIYTFKNKSKSHRDTEDLDFVLSNTLTF